MAVKLEQKKTADGGTVHYLGPLEAKDLIVIIGRSNFAKDDLLIQALIESLREQNHTIIWYEHAGISTARSIAHESDAYLLKNKNRPILVWANNTMKKVRWLQKFKKSAVRAYMILKTPGRWRKLALLWLKKADELPFQTESLRSFIQSLGPDRNIVIISRSSGGRASSIIADEPSIKKLICIGYPFKHPGMPEEPERTAHLAQLQKPFLIIQGTRDEYGGKDVRDRYLLSPQISLEFIETGHDFRVSEAVWKQIMDKIRAFIEN